MNKKNGSKDLAHQYDISGFQKHVSVDQFDLGYE